ncbi:cell wall protein, partial [Nocardiopsis sp. MG754419]|nr:cell wall protein [Nocardiopsis sp. MG754419]
AHPRTTTVNRTQGLAPEGDTVTVSGIGHTPGTGIEITTRAVPAEVTRDDEVDGAAVLDTDNTVATEVDERGLFSVTLDTGVGFAAEAGLDTDEDPFEIVVLDVRADGSDAPSEPARPEEDEGTDGTDGSADSPGDDDLIASPG